MMACFNDREEETGLFLESDFCLNKHAEGSIDFGNEVVSGDVFFGDESQEKTIFESDGGALKEEAPDFMPGSYSCCPQPLFECDGFGLTRPPNMLVDSKMFPDMSLGSEVTLVSNMSMVGVSCFGFDEGEEHWTTWDALLPQAAAKVRSGAGQVVPYQVEAVLCASAAGPGDCRRTRFDGLTGRIPDQGGFGDFGLRGEVLEGEVDSLVSTFQGKVTSFVLPRSSHEHRNPCHRLLVQDTISPKFQIFRFRETLFPLLSQLSESDSSWWLLDSGASTTVLSEKFAHEYGVDVSKMFSKDSPYRAANGTPVKMLGKAEVGVGVVMVDEWGESRVKRHAKLRAMIGNIQHNIISTTSLCKTGWQFWQGEDWCELINTVSGEKATEVGFFAGCPWVKLHAEKSSSLSSTLQSGFGKSVSFDEGGSLAPLTRGAEQELLRHRLQGHTPHDPRCIECARGHTVFAHRRRSQSGVECELQADFCYLSSRGEFTDDEVDECFKVLVLVEMASNSVGFILVTRDLQQTRAEIAKWLDLMGLASEKASVVLHTDSEFAVGQLVSRVAPRFSFTIRRAAPQQHRSVGAAERGVRRLKEALGILRADLNKNGQVDIPFTSESLQLVLCYLGLTHNHFGKAIGSELSPLEFIAMRKLSKPSTSVYGSVVLAELPQSLLKDSPNETRSIEAIYLHAGLGTGPVVQGKIRVNGEYHLKRFVARNLKPIFPLSWKLELSGDLLVRVEGHETPAAVADEGARVDVERALPSHSEQVAVEEPSPDYVEYPDGAPPELVREMKEADMDVGLPRKRKEVPVVAKERPLTIRRQGPLTAAPAVEERRPDVRDVEVVEPPQSVEIERGVFGKTPRCPACESGMNVPGIRHSAVCKRRFEAFQRNEVPPETVASPTRPVEPSEVEVASGPGDSHLDVPVDSGLDAEEAYRSSVKRPADVDVDTLEQEIREEAILNISSLLDSGIFDADSGQPILSSVFSSLEAPASFEPLTSPEFFMGDLDSIVFHGKEGHKSVQMQLGGAKILVWQPDEIVDDATLGSLDAGLGYIGMQDEVRNLDKCKTGEAMTKHQVDRLVQQHPDARVITCRWVAADKGPNKVRCRVVAKDIAKGTSSARALGFSSPTPSIEGLHLMLTLSANRGNRLSSIDISHAFMHSPIPDGEWVVLRLPLSISFPNGEAVYLLLFRSLNGLRNASAHWMSLLSNTIKSIGLWSDPIEPCIFGGFVVDPKTKKQAGSAMLMAYVDDILISASNRRTEEIIKQTIGAVVPAKDTGCVLPADEGGGTLVFIGRRITREAGHSPILLSVDDSYLTTTFEEFQIVSGSHSAPDVASHLEKTISDPNGKKPLSPEAYSRFRRCLGKLLWLSQSRHDLKVWLSIIGCQQASPCQGTEAAIRSVLRFLYKDRNVVLSLPSPEYHQLVVSEQKSMTCHLHSFADASFAPYRFNNRKGISGGIVFSEGGLVRSFARQQQSLSLSSCEAEVYAIQLLSQEAVSFARFTHRLLYSLGEVSEPEVVQILLESDSSSALQLLNSEGLPRRSRHIEIRLLWLQDQISSGKLVVKHKPGVSHPADLFTKCLGTKDFFRHRSMIGFIQRDGPVCDLAALTSAVEVQPLAFVELCCKEQSSLQKACYQSGISYAGVVKNIELKSVQLDVNKFVKRSKNEGRWVHLHVSTPCSSGSPLKNFSQSVTDSDLDWEGIMSGVKDFLSLEPKPDCISFELPKGNAVWSRGLTVEVLSKGGMNHFQDVHLCQAQYKIASGTPIGKVLRFQCSHSAFCQSLKRFGTCTCKEHAPFSSVSWVDTGFYNKTLARGIINGAKAAFRSQR